MLTNILNRKMVNWLRLKKFFGSHLLIGIGLAVLASIPVFFGDGFQAAAQAQEGGSAWSTPVIISPDPDKPAVQWFPEIVADLASRVHVFWTSANNTGESGYDTVIYCVIEGEFCSDPSEIVAFNGVGVVTRPAAVVDAQNRIHLLSRRTEIFYSRALADNAYRSSAWSSKHTISGISGDAAYSDIAIDSKGVIHVVWSAQIVPPDGEVEGLACPYCSDIFYRQSADYGQTWSSPIDLTNSAMGAEKPQLVLNKEDDLFLFWEEGEDFYSPTKAGEPISSGLVSSFDGGQHWTLPTMFIFPGDAPQRVTGGVDWQDKLIVVWGLMQGREIYYQISSDQGQSWSRPRPIPGVQSRSLDNDLDTYNMAADSAGHLHLVLVGQRPGDNDELSSVLHLEWDGIDWSEPETIFTVNNDLPEWPRIAIANGNQLHVTWFVRDFEHIFNVEDPEANYRIWYAHGLSSAPEVIPDIPPTPTPTIAPELLTTPTPTATPTTVPTPTPTLDPVIARASVSTEAANTIYTDADELLILALSLAPVVLIVIVVVLGSRGLKHRGR